MGDRSGQESGRNTQFDAPSRRDRDSRLPVIVVADALAWVLAIGAATGFYDRSPFDRRTLAVMAVAVVVQIAAGYGTGIYRGMFRRFSFDEAGALAVAVGIAGVTTLVLEYVRWNDGQSGQIIVLGTSVAVCLMAGHRYMRRVRLERTIAARSLHRTPVIIYGAGEGGHRAVNAMQGIDSSPYRAVAFIDDDPRRRHRRAGQVRVEGDSTCLAAVAKRYDAKAVLLAMPSATAEELKRLHLIVKAAGLETLVMPPVQKLVGTGSHREITRYTDEDVLNRKIVEIDPAAIRDLTSGTCVLVTGAGGSIGSELVRQLVALEPKRVIALDRDDSLLHRLIGSLPTDRAETCTPVIADVRDIDRLDEVFGRHHPTVVFHAAALKHVPALEGAPSEGWKTNVVGTSNVLEVCERHDVHTMVNISTDKAADPENVLGYTKRIAERLTAARARSSRRTFVSVRFGNVIGSRGSALETFELQIAQGGPVTITHPDVTRYFMAVREAVRLTMQAAAIGSGGETLVLDMGSPVKVLDVASQLIEQSGEDIEIVYTGLRPGEKMHEVLLGEGEKADRPLHPMIDHVTVVPLGLPEAVDLCAQAGLSPTTIDGLRMLAREAATTRTTRSNRPARNVERVTPERRRA
jgi:FlaA1/EpsC-like NDP-sugar epimerase